MRGTNCTDGVELRPCASTEEWKRKWALTTPGQYACDANRLSGFPTTSPTSQGGGEGGPTASPTLAPVEATEAPTTLKRKKKSDVFYKRAVDEIANIVCAEREARGTKGVVVAAAAEAVRTTLIIVTRSAMASSGCLDQALHQTLERTARCPAVVRERVIRRLDGLCQLAVVVVHQ